MKVRLTSDGALVSEAEGTVWQEKFTAAEASNIAYALDKFHQSLNCPGGELIAAQVLRVANMFHALTNDSDACVVTVQESLVAACPMPALDAPRAAPESVAER